jgi:hypothetical protein
MVYFKCLACRTRLAGVGSPPDLIGDLCPICGSLLEPVDALGEVVGFRSIEARDNATRSDPPGTHERIAERVEDFHSGRRAMRAQARVDAQRWIDDGGSFRARPVSVGTDA